jgi:hypothetical protein
VHIVRRRPGRRLTETGTGDDDGDFALERNRRFQHAGRGADFGPCGGNVIGGPDPGLALAIIAVAAGLQQSGSAKFRQGLGNVMIRIDHAIVRRGDADIVQEGLLLGPVLRDGERLCAGIKVVARRFDHVGSDDGDVLEFQRDDGAGLGELGQQGLVVIGAFPVMAGNACGGRIVFRAIDVDIEAQPLRSIRQHAAQLAAAEDPDNAAWRDRCHPSGVSPTPSVCA